MTEEQPNALCERVQYCIAVGDPLTAEQKTHLDTCRECQAFGADMATLDEALPELSAGMLTNKKGQSVSESVAKELALQQRFDTKKQTPKLFRHFGLAAAAVVVVVGGVIVMNARKAMKPANSALVADAPMMTSDACFVATGRDEAAADETEAAVCEENDCAAGYEYVGQVESPEEESAVEYDGGTVNGDITLFAAEDTVDEKKAAEPERPATPEGSDAVTYSGDKAAKNEKDAPQIPMMTVRGTVKDKNTVVTGSPAEESVMAANNAVKDDAAIEEEPSDSLPEAETEPTADNAAKTPSKSGAGSGAPSDAERKVMTSQLYDAAPEEPEGESEEKLICEACAVPDSEALPMLTIQTLIELSKKGEALTWEDFAAFDGYDIGSGLYIMCYDIDERYYVLVGGSSRVIQPYYIKLCDAQNADRSIDVRAGDVEAFLQEE